MSHPDRFVADLSSQVQTVLGELIRPGDRVALVNFPNHANGGDPAIWMGEVAALERLQANVVYRASWASYDAMALRRALRSGTILIQGGGNLGDLYPHRQAAIRERILEELSDIRTIQLPQSIHYRERENLVRMAQLLEAHTDVTLLVREKMSLEIARAEFDVPSLLCPDMAFAIGRRFDRPTPALDVLWLNRRDAEQTERRLPESTPGRLEIVDWLDHVPGEPRWPLGDRSARALNRWFVDHYDGRAWLRQGAWRLDAALFDRLAMRWVTRAIDILGRGRVVITNRLHAHILCLLTGIPHVVLDNSYGKVRAVFDTWTRDHPLAHWAGDPDEALDRADTLLETGP